MKRNKARYTATSCGRVGRGGNARFLTFRLVSTDRPTDRPMDGWTDRPSYRDARTQLKMLWKDGPTNKLMDQWNKGPAVWHSKINTIPVKLRVLVNEFSSLFLNIDQQNLYSHEKS